MNPKWLLPDQLQMEEEWATECLDSLYTIGYPSAEEKTEFKTHFFDNLGKISERETLEDLSGLNHYRPKSLDDLKQITSHMSKNIDALNDRYLNDQLPMPLLMRKKGELTILGGRTRISLAHLYNDPVEALVIDFEKFADTRRSLRLPDYVNTGFAELVFESRKKRFEILAKLKSGKTNEIENTGEIWSELSPAEREELLRDLSDWLGIEYSPPALSSSRQSSEDQVDAMSKEERIAAVKKLAGADLVQTLQ